MYRPDIRRSVVQVFKLQMANNSLHKSPLTKCGSTTFCHLQVQNLFLVAATNLNANCTVIFELLYKIIDIIAEFCGKFTENKIRVNFSLVYCLLDQIIQYGYPVTTDIAALRATLDTKKKQPESAQLTGIAPWRKQNIKHKRNEIFIDIVECVNFLGTSDGVCIKSDINGKILLNSLLSGLPHCKLGLSENTQTGNDSSAQVQKRNAKTEFRNTRTNIEDFKFHQCVDLVKFEKENVISFIPADGKFELMQYRTEENIRVPFKVQAQVLETSKTLAEIRLSIRSTFKASLAAQNMIIKVPVPPNTIRVKNNLSFGLAKYKPAENVIRWK